MRESAPGTPVGRNQDLYTGDPIPITSIVIPPGTTSLLALHTSRIEESLHRLELAAEHTFRHTPTGELVESLACSLTGRSSWWPDTSPQPTDPAQAGDADA